MRVGDDVMRLLKLVEDGFRKHNIRDTLELEAADLRFNIWEQGDAMAGLRRTKDKLLREAINICLRVQMKKEATINLKRGTEFAAANLVGLAQSQAARTTLSPSDTCCWK